MSGGGEAMLYPYRPAGEHRLPGLRPGCAAGPGALLGLMRDVGQLFDCEPVVLQRPDSPALLLFYPDTVFPWRDLAEVLGRREHRDFLRAMGYTPWEAPGDAPPPSRFVRAAFYRATAPQRATGFETVQQCLHLLNNFDIPIGIEHPEGECPDIPSATQWTSAIDLTNRRIYYKTAYNNTIRCIDLAGIDFGKTAYQSHPLDRNREQPVQQIAIPE